MARLGFGVRGVLLGAALGLGGLALGTARAPGAPAPSAPASSLAEPAAAPDPAPAPADAPERPIEPATAAVPPVASYTLTARLDDTNQTIHGEGTLTWVNTSTESTSELYFHLYLNAFENAETLFNRSPFTRARSGRTTRRWGKVTLEHLSARELGGADLLPSLEPHSPDDPRDRTDRRLPLPRAIAPGETLTFDLAWDSVLPDIVERTGASRDFFFAGQWFPKVARLERDGTWAHFPFHPHAEFYADFGNYDVTLDVPDAMVVGATGRRVSEVALGNRRKLRQRAEGVHDFAWVAWPAFERHEERIAGVDVHLLYPPGHAKNAERTLEALRFGLPHFGERYGAYPYPDLTVVHPPEHAGNAGGMEYPTLITTGGPWHQAYWSRAVELVTIHELGHQWFYGLLASEEPRFPFLDEGLNSYAESVATEAMFGPSSAGRVAGLELSATTLHRSGMLLGPHDAPIAQAASEFVDFQELGGLVYSRTALLFRTIANVYGRERMERALHAYATRHRFTHPGPEALLDALETELGAAATANVKAALFEGAGVNYSVRELRSVRLPEVAGAGGAGGAPAAARFESRVVIHRQGELMFPVNVELVTSRGERVPRTWSGAGRDEIITFTGDAPVVSARVDPEDAILLDENLLDNSRSVEHPPLVGTWDRALFAAELLLGGLTP